MKGRPRRRLAAARAHLLLILIALGLVALIAVSVWFTVSVPCELYKFSSTKDIPGRCVMR